MTGNLFQPGRAGTARIAFVGVAQTPVQIRVTDACAWRRSRASSGLKSYEIVDALPRNNYGKALKTGLRRRLG
ncbi:MAG: hypothetical protein ACYCZ6_00800 [Polaromonas sp.]